jgi:putative transposase
VLGQFSLQRKRAIAKYVDFVRAGVGLPSVWDQLKNQIYLGGDKFVARMQKAISPTQDLSEVPRAHRRAVAKPLAFYAQRHADPKIAMAVAYLSGDYSMKTIAGFFGVHYATVSRAVQEYEQGQGE